MDDVNTLVQLLGSFPGTTDEILRYKCAVVRVVYDDIRPNFSELATGIRRRCAEFGIDPADSRFDRNLVYSVAILRTEKIIKRIPLHDEDIYLIEDALKPVLERLLNPSHCIGMMNASAPTEVSSPLNQSILMEPEPLAGPPVAGGCNIV